VALPDEGQQREDGTPTWDGPSIAAACEAAGVSVSSAAAEQMARHLEMVYDANAHINLTRVPSGRAAELHVADSLSGLAEMSASPPGPWADVGSGAGFPGIPLCVTSGRHVDLIESVGKKAAVLSTISQTMRLDVSVLACRAEEAAERHPAHWSAVAARAVAPLASLVELASPLLCAGGLLVCWKGALAEEEVAQGSRAASSTGMRLTGVRRFVLPGGEERAIVVYTKTGRPSLRLPRRPGTAQHSPLA
jgi:16S rRNA (guanine527-N7)-methyltransferase